MLKKAFYTIVDKSLGNAAYFSATKRSRLIELNQTNLTNRYQHPRQAICLGNQHNHDQSAKFHEHLTDLEL